MKTRFNEIARLVRGTVKIAIGIAAVTMYDSPASETTIEKLNDLAPAVVATNGSMRAMSNRTRKTLFKLVARNPMSTCSIIKLS